MSKTKTVNLAKWIGLTMTAGVVLVSAVWSVAVLSVSNVALAESIGRLDDTLKLVGAQLLDHNTRISRLEGRTGSLETRGSP